MALSRRSFLQRTATGAGAAALLQFPLAPRLYASPEPARIGEPNGEILLNSNENAYGPLPSAMKAMQQTLTRANRYPDFQYRALISAIAASNGVKEDQVLLGTGSTELLRASAFAFSGQGRGIVVADPTFEAIEEFGEEAQATIIRVPLTATYAHDLEGMLQRAGSNVGLVYICNPNNPTASVTPANDVEAFIAKLPATVTVVIDEAYHHFAIGMTGYRSFMQQAGDRLVVLRTFSKIYGMAGMRLGYAIASATTIRKMAEFRLPINVNIVAYEGGIASMADDTAMMFASKRNAADRAEFTRQAESRKVTMIPSYANFAMVKTGRPIRQVKAAFAKQNVLVGRPFPPMLEWMRVTFGLPEDMKAFWQAWDTVQA